MKSNKYQDRLDSAKKISGWDELNAENQQALSLLAYDKELDVLDFNEAVNEEFAKHRPDTQKFNQENESSSMSPRVIEYSDGGNSAVIVDKPGATVDLMGGDDRNLRSPMRNPMGRILISGKTESGETVRLVIGNNYAVAFGVNAAGKQFAEVSLVSKEDLADLAEPLIIGGADDRFNNMTITQVAAEYRALCGGASEKVKSQNPFSIADRLIEKAKGRRDISND